jgi:hypothetical protein
LPNFRSKSSVLVGLFACASIVGAVSWNMVQAQPKMIAAASSAAVPLKVATGSTGHDIKLHMSYQLGRSVEPVADTKKPVQIALADARLSP